MVRLGDLKKVFFSFLFLDWRRKNVQLLDNIGTFFFGWTSLFFFFFMCRRLARTSLYSQFFVT